MTATRQTPRTSDAGASRNPFHTVARYLDEGERPA